MSKTEQTIEPAIEADHANVISEPRWETDWSNLKRRRQTGEHKISDYMLQKRKSRYLARERDIDRQHAANLLKHGDAEVPDEVVL